MAPHGAICLGDIPCSNGLDDLIEGILRKMLRLKAVNEQIPDTQGQVEKHLAFVCQQPIVSGFAQHSMELAVNCQQRLRIAATFALLGLNNQAAHLIDLIGPGALHGKPCGQWIQFLTNLLHVQ